MWCAAAPELPDETAGDGRCLVARRGRPKRSTIRRTQSPPGPGWGELEPWARAMFQLQEAEARGDAAEGLGITDAFQFGLLLRPAVLEQRTTERSCT